MKKGKIKEQTESIGESDENQQSREEAIPASAVPLIKFEPTNFEG